jgi:hypothetical protein
MKNEKIYEAFKPKADLQLNFQLCRAYLNDNTSVLGIVEKILNNKFGGLHPKDRQMIKDLRGQRNPVIELPYHQFKATEEEVLADYVALRFDKMVNEVMAGKEGYPLVFRDIVEKYQ